MKQDELAGKRLVILGLARQGKALARFAVQAGAQVVVSDLRAPDKLADGLAELTGLGIQFVLGEHPLSLLDGTDVLAVSGGVPAGAPIVQAAQARGIRVTNDALEFMRRTPAQVIGITGSAGKTTTTALTGAMGQAAGRTTWIGGNIGNPLIADLARMQPGDLVVQELSSFQLELWTSRPPVVPPAVATVLNVTPNHLDRHGTLAAYAAAKANILRFQAEDGITVLNADDQGSERMAGMAPGRVRWFSMASLVDDGAYCREGQIWLKGRGGEPQTVCDVAQIRLRGRHNLANVLAAVTLADSVGIPLAAMRQAIADFRGVPHRLEMVATINGV
ncbi:MAG: UDP-N-acetylmuramoyl-L-alanine--D-glutamate ligase, partial [Anaerolineales bacterium]|nr:UDP-N-acetylmuramoyl-L-alanine--D-glutamate ligase [Anaerolineales bacterium]